MHEPGHAVQGVRYKRWGYLGIEKPEADNADKTLIAMAVLLGIMFLGVTYLAHAVQVVPVEYESVVSQIGRAVLLFRQAHGGEARIVINVPYHLRGCRPVMSPWLDGMKQSKSLSY